MEIRMQPTIDIQDILADFGLNSVSEFMLVEEVGNGDYTFFGTDEDYLSDLSHAFFDCGNRDIENDPYLRRKYRRLGNDLRLLNQLRNMGYQDGVLIQVWW